MTLMRWWDNLKTKTKFDHFRFAAGAMLSALAVVLSMLEGMLPEIPIPGAKLGLSNLAVMTAADLFGFWGGFVTVLAKSFFAVISRGPTAGFMSLCGSMLSMLLMLVFIKYDRKCFLGYVGIGVVGAVSHNIGQLFAAWLIIGGSVFFYFPFLLAAGVFTGAFTGFVNSLLIPVIRKSYSNNF